MLSTRTTANYMDGKKQNASELRGRTVAWSYAQAFSTETHKLPTAQCVHSLVDEDVAFSTNMYTNRILSLATPSVTGSVNKEHL